MNRTVDVQQRLVVRGRVSGGEEARPELLAALEVNLQGYGS